MGVRFTVGLSGAFEQIVLEPSGESERLALLAECIRLRLSTLVLSPPPADEIRYGTRFIFRPEPP